MPFRRRTDRHFEHRSKETRDEGEDQHKSFVSDKGGKGLDVGNRELSLLAWGMAPKSLQFQCVLRRCMERHRHDLEELGRSLAKLASPIQRDATKAQ